MVIPEDLKLLVNTAVRTAGLAQVMCLLYAKYQCLSSRIVGYRSPGTAWPICKFLTWRNAKLGQLGNLLLRLIHGDHLIYLGDYCRLVCDTALTKKTVICIFPPIRMSYFNADSFLFTVPGVDSTDAAMKHFYVFFRWK